MKFEFSRLDETKKVSTLEPKSSRLNINIELATSTPGTLGFRGVVLNQGVTDRR
jgi:hypothetical protein